MTWSLSTQDAQDECPTSLSTTSIPVTSLSDRESSDASMSTSTLPQLLQQESGGDEPDSQVREREQRVTPLTRLLHTADDHFPHPTRFHAAQPPCKTKPTISTHKRSRSSSQPPKSGPGTLLTLPEYGIFEWVEDKTDTDAVRMIVPVLGVFELANPPSSSSQGNIMIVVPNIGSFQRVGNDGVGLGRVIFEIPGMGVFASSPSSANTIDDAAFVFPGHGPVAVDEIIRPKTKQRRYPDAPTARCSNADCPSKNGHGAVKFALTRIFVEELICDECGHILCDICVEKKHKHEDVSKEDYDARIRKEWGIYQRTSSS
jgi:hypothetical protein